MERRILKIQTVGSRSRTRDWNFREMGNRRGRHTGQEFAFPDSHDMRTAGGRDVQEDTRGREKGDLLLEYTSGIVNRRELVQVK